MKVRIICNNCGEVIECDNLNIGDRCPECHCIFTGKEEIEIINN